jgi:ComF family protein
VQHLLHQLKYSGNRELGIYFGRIYGNELKFTSFFEDIDCLVPVPLHPRKIRKRGYNQSEVFAQGLAGPAALEIISNCLYRKVHSSTQTRKGRYNRWENVGEIFGVRDEDKLINKHILLVDDVVTTGATLEACAQVLVSIPGVRVSVAAIAYAA